jgi:hypothetical protein
MSLDSFQQNMYYDSANTPPPLLNYFLVWLWLKLIFLYILTKYMQNINIYNIKEILLELSRNILLNYMN